jgi:hypothetical protein
MLDGRQSKGISTLFIPFDCRKNILAKTKKTSFPTRLVNGQRELVYIFPTLA